MRTQDSARTFSKVLGMTYLKRVDIWQVYGNEYGWITHRIGLTPSPPQSEKSPSNCPRFFTLELVLIRLISCTKSIQTWRVYSQGTKRSIRVIISRSSISPRQVLLCSQKRTRICILICFNFIWLWDQLYFYSSHLYLTRTPTLFC